MRPAIPTSVRTTILRDVLVPLATQLIGFTVTPANVIDGGDHVAVEGRYTGTVKATGARLDAQFVHVYGLRDGKIVRFQQYTDTAQWVKALAGFDARQRPDPSPRSSRSPRAPRAMCCAQERQCFQGPAASPLVWQL